MCVFWQERHRAVISFSQMTVAQHKIRASGLGASSCREACPGRRVQERQAEGAEPRLGLPGLMGTPICVCSWDGGCLWPAVPSVGSMTPNRGRTGTKADAGSADRTGTVEAFGHSPLNSGVRFSSLTRSSRLPLYLLGETALVLESSPFY